MSGKRMTIGLLGEGNARPGLSSWPGTRYYMARALQKHVGDVINIDTRPLKAELFGRIFDKLVQTTLRRRYDFRHSMYAARAYSRLVQREVEDRKPDLLFVSAMSTETVLVDSCPPIIYTSDTTFANVRDYYSIYSRMLDSSLQQAEEIEMLMLQKSELVLYPSSWACRSAVVDYGADSNKVHVIPYGANIDESDVPPVDLVLNRSSSPVCRLLFLGVNWERKGGEIAFQTMMELNGLGVPTQLTVCGCIPPESCINERVRVIPYLDKTDARGRKEFADLLLATDYLVLPTRNECYGMVFCEASAFGVPSITTRTGGVGGAVTDGENGYMLPVVAGGREYAELVKAVYVDDRRRRDLIQSSRRAYDERLNWNAWAQSVGKLVAEM